MKPSRTKSPKRTNSKLPTNVPKAFRREISRFGTGKSMSMEQLNKCSKKGSPIADAEINRRNRRAK